MDGRKVLILLDHKAGALSCIRFVVGVFRHKHTAVVLGYTNHQALEDVHRKIKSEIHAEFGELSNLKFIYRNQQVLSGAAIIQESQFCDLIVQPAQSRFALKTPRNHNFSTDINLPIVTVPDGFKMVSEILIIHNGEFNQLQFIKLFFQILGDLCHEASVTLVELNHNSSHFSQSDEKLFVEYLRVHCPNLGIIKAAGESPEKLLKMVNFTNGIVVSSHVEGFPVRAINHPAMFREINLSQLVTSTANSSQSV